MSIVSGEFTRNGGVLMDLNNLSKDFAEYKKGNDKIAQVLRDISKLDTNRKDNIPKLKAKIEKLEEKIAVLPQGTIQKEHIHGWAESYKRELDGLEEKRNKLFGKELESPLKELGLTLSGHYPELKVWLFTLELDFTKGFVTLWYGPKQERLDRFELSVAEVVKRVRTSKEKLGGDLSGQEFAQKAHDAFIRVTGGKKEDAYLPELIPELALLVQSAKFYQNPIKENFKSYSRADFSYDLFRHWRSDEHTLLKTKWKLGVAARSETNKRKHFLWVPSDEKGDGAVYSRIRFEEGS